MSKKKASKKTASVRGKSGSTRARVREPRKKATKKAAKKVTKRKRTGRRKRQLLDMGAALRILANGGTLKNAARAAGSTADEENLTRIGNRIREKLTNRGLAYDAFNRIGLTLERVCRSIAERIEATKVDRHFYKDGRGRLRVKECEDIDNGARAQAAEQYMTATGLKTLPVAHEGEPSPLADLTADELFALELEDEAGDGGE